jgi:hypothetical protein
MSSAITGCTGTSIMKLAARMELLTAKQELGRGEDMVDLYCDIGKCGGDTTHRLDLDNSDRNVSLCAVHWHELIANWGCANE